MEYRLRQFFVLLLTSLLLSLNANCKHVKSSRSTEAGSGVSQKNQWIVWVLDWKNKTEIIDIGEVQPDGGIAYDTNGMERLAWLVEDMLLTNTFVDEGLFQSIERQAKMAKYDSSQIARNTLPKELIQAPLWNKGIRWDFFIWPMDQLKPDNLETAYKTLKPEDREKMTPFNPLLGVDEITFQRLMMYYRSVYDLPVFQRIRINVAKDKVYQGAASTFQSAASQAVNTASMFAYPSVNGLWKYLIPQTGKIAGTGRFIGTLFTFVLPQNYIQAQIHNAMYEDNKWREDLQDLRALRQDGAIKGPEYLAKNREVIEWFKNGDGARLAPHFAKFITHKNVSWFVLDPVNCYELQMFVDEVKGIDQVLLAKLNAQQDLSAVQTFAESLAGGIGASQMEAAGQCVSKQRVQELDDAARQQAIDIIKTGSRSALFNEMLLMSLVKMPDRKIEIGKDPRHAGATSNSGPIQLFSGTLKWETNSQLAMVYTLAHETWHATSKHWIFNQLFRFTGPREFLLAIAGDETVASLLSLAVRDEVKRDRQGLLENAADFIDSMNFIGQFNMLARFNPQDLQQEPLFDVVSQTQTNALKEWRSDSVPIVELPQPPKASPPPWYARWFAHLGGVWARWYPPSVKTPCDVFTSP